jgi:hypothetical protein
MVFSKKRKKFRKIIVTTCSLKAIFPSCTRLRNQLLLLSFSLCLKTLRNPWAFCEGLLTGQNQPYSEIENPANARFLYYLVLPEPVVTGTAVYFRVAVEEDVHESAAQQLW